MKNPNVISRDPDHGLYDGDLCVKKLYDLASSTTHYIGRAELGTPTSAAAWTINKITYDGSGNPTSSLWTDGAIGVWDNRASETYT